MQQTAYLGRSQRGAAGRAAALAVPVLAALVGLAACAAPEPRTDRPTTVAPGDAAIVPPAGERLPATDYVRELLAERMRRNGVGIVVGLVDRDGRRVIVHGRTGTPVPDDPSAALGGDSCASGAGDAGMCRSPLEAGLPDAAARLQPPVDRAVDGTTVFQIGSLTKVFTGLLLADMVTRGEVELDDPASRYLPPGVTMPQRGRAITLRDLATHRSGLPSMPANLSLQARPDPYEGYSVAELHRFLAEHRLRREPGAEAEYSNLAVALLGRLLARRAGMEYEDLLQQRVLRPLAMHSTSIALSADQRRRLAHGHDRDLRPVRTWEMRILPASGSLRSSAEDMLAFLALYLGTGPSPLAAAVQLQLHDGVPSGSGWQALGWFVRSDGLVVHAGGKQGFRSALAFDPASRRGVVVLANARTDDQPMAIALHLLAGTPLPPAPSAPDRPILDVERAVLDGYAGIYRTDSDQVIEVARRDTHLLLHTPGRGVWEFLPTTDGRFFLNTGNDEIAFRRDGARVSILVWYGDGTDDGEITLARRSD